MHPDTPCYHKTTCGLRRHLLRGVLAALGLTVLYVLMTKLGLAANHSMTLLDYVTKPATYVWYILLGYSGTWRVFYLVFVPYVFLVSTLCSIGISFLLSCPLRTQITAWPIAALLMGAYFGGMYYSDWWHARKVLEQRLIDAASVVEPTEEQVRVENAARRQIGLRVVGPGWSFDPSRMPFEGHEVWSVPRPRDDSYFPRHLKTQVMKVVKRHLDGSIAEELDYYFSGRYYLMNGDGPRTPEEGYHDEFLYTKYEYGSGTLSLTYVGTDADIYFRCEALKHEPRTFTEVASGTDELLAIWHLSRL